MIKLLFSKAFLINLLAALLFVVVVVWGIFKYIDSYTLHNQTITVPELEGLNIDEVEDLLKSKELNFSILDSIYVTDAEKGVVLEQSPFAESQVKKNRTIYVTVSKINPPKVNMPNVVDMSQRLAVAKIESCGLVIGNLKYIPSECVNCVLSQQIKGKDIKPGSPIEKGTTIDLVLGSGTSNEKVFAPYIIGLTKEEAIAKLQASFLNLGAETYNDCENYEDSLNARIYKQAPIKSSNIVVNMGTSVDVWFTADTNKINIDNTLLNDTLNMNVDSLNND